MHRIAQHDKSHDAVHYCVNGMLSSSQLIEFRATMLPLQVHAWNFQGSLPAFCLPLLQAQPPKRLDCPGQHCACILWG